MLKRHSRVIARINSDRLTKFLVCDYFDLARKVTLMATLLERRLGQADLVLCLLKLRDRASIDHRRVLSYYIRLLVGRPIAVGTPCLLNYRINGHAPTVEYSTPQTKLVWVAPLNPRRNSTGAHLRWQEFKVGLTIPQLRVRGVTRRDIRRATRLGWIRFKEDAA